MLTRTGINTNTRMMLLLDEFEMGLSQRSGKSRNVCIYCTIMEILTLLYLSDNVL